MENDVEVGLSMASENNQNEELSGPCPTIVITDCLQVNAGIKTEISSQEQVVVISEVNENESRNKLSDSSIDSIKVQSVTEPVALTEPSQQKEIAKRFYPGDVVVQKVDGIINSKQWQPFFGTVLKPAPGSEMSKSLDKGSSGEFHVHWDFSNRIANAKASDVSLVDRILLRGQRVESTEGKIGTVVDYNVSATVQINGTNHIIERVPLQRLRPISPYVRGQEVLLNGWVGVVTSIKRNVWFRMDGGSIFRVEATERDGFTRADPFWGLGVACPGMRTRLPTAAMKTAKWLTSPQKYFNKWLPLHYLYAWAYSTIIRTDVMRQPFILPNCCNILISFIIQIKFHVKIKVVELEVKWLQLADTTSTALPPSIPIAIVNREKLRQLLVIGTPSTETVGINSVRKLRLWPNDEISNYDVWIEGFRRKYIDGDDGVLYATTKPDADPHLTNLV
ncbi:unnamed protein product [Orchesella dallaii]|uniref:Uncharacterized protein n=1 Tax=Orchesella dallaii TaxID=48710 RepID=A0ABP1RD91_9HEXA